MWQVDCDVRETGWLSPITEQREAWLDTDKLVMGIMAFGGYHISAVEQSNMASYLESLARSSGSDTSSSCIPRRLRHVRIDSSHSWLVETVLGLYDWSRDINTLQVTLTKLERPLPLTHHIMLTNVTLIGCQLGHLTPTDLGLLLQSLPASVTSLNISNNYIKWGQEVFEVAMTSLPPDLKQLNVWRDADIRQIISVLHLLPRSRINLRWNTNP